MSSPSSSSSSGGGGGANSPSSTFLPAATHACNHSTVTTCSPQPVAALNFAPSATSTTRCVFLLRPRRSVYLAPSRWHSMCTDALTHSSYNEVLIRSPCIDSTGASQGSGRYAGLPPPSPPLVRGMARPICTDISSQWQVTWRRRSASGAASSVRRSWGVGAAGHTMYAAEVAAVDWWLPRCPPPPPAEAAPPPAVLGMVTAMPPPEAMQSRAASSSSRDSSGLRAMRTPSKGGTSPPPKPPSSPPSSACPLPKNGCVSGMAKAVAGSSVPVAGSYEHPASPAAMAIARTAAGDWICLWCCPQGGLFWSASSVAAAAAAAAARAAALSAVAAKPAAAASAAAVSAAAVAASACRVRGFSESEPSRCRSSAAAGGAAAAAMAWEAVPNLKRDRPLPPAR
mmetsp:Transcript_23833/g.59101  ORF Transcript_23833/g.59101 Transcript_23833/m.59101 type:complete len:398 (-) Transcript_23833:184-1377(-)